MAPNMKIFDSMKPKEIYRVLHISHFVFNILDFRHTLIKFCPVLGIATSLIPVLYGCESPIFHQDEVFTKAENALVKMEVLNDMAKEDIDVLIFEDDATMRLECYQNFDHIEGNELEIGTTTGRKIAFICANSTTSPDDWLKIRTFPALSKVHHDLENEEYDRPFMSGTTEFDSRNNRISDASLERLGCEIVLKSIACDFKGKPYEGQKLDDVKVYLTNVNASCSILPEDIIHPSRIINQDRLIENDLDGFIEPRLIYHEIDNSIGKSPMDTELVFMCYPNSSVKEYFGSSPTRMVIEGSLDGNTWYWPVNIGDPEQGLKRNHRYIYDIRLSRKGATRPDSAIFINEIVTDYEVVRWEEKEEYSVSF